MASALASQSAGSTLGTARLGCDYLCLFLAERLHFPRLHNLEGMPLFLSSCARCTLTDMSAPDLAKPYAQRERCRAWLRSFIRRGEPFFWTKEELRAAAFTELRITEAAFDEAWNLAVAGSGVRVSGRPAVPG
jgi:hypothetical protein